MVEFVQWFPHSFLKNHLLSQWDSGDFVLQPVRPLTATCYGFRNTRPILRSEKRGEDGVRRVFLIYKSSGCLTRPNVFFKGVLSGNGTVLCPFERCCRGQLWEGSPWTDKSRELSLCLSCCSNLECIIKGEASGRVLASTFSQSCKSSEFIVAVTLGPRSSGFHWCSQSCLLWSCR